MTNPQHNPAFAVRVESLLAEASDPRTAPERLERLAGHRITEVRQAVARNPNTPATVLLRLAARLPEALLENPILDLLLLENPNWLQEIPSYAASSLLRSHAAPPGFLSWAVAWGEAEMLLAVAANPNTPQAVLERLRDHDDPRVAEAVKLHVKLSAQLNPPAFLEVLHATELERDRERLKDLLAAQAAPAWLLEVLVTDQDAELRACVATQPDATAQALTRLSSDEDEKVRHAARHNPRCPADVVALHARLEHLDPGLNQSELDAAAQLGAWALRQCASHPNTAPRLLEQLVSDDDWRTRQALARNPSLNATHLAVLARDSDRDVRAAAASNPSATPAILEPLLNDANDEVRETALKHPKAPLYVLADIERVRNGDTNLVASELEALCRRGDWARRLVVQHPNMPPEALERDANSADWHTRQAVASNPNTPSQALEKLSQDSDADVRSAVATNPNLPFAVLERLTADINHEVRKAAARNPHMTSALLALLAEDSNWMVRQAVALNPTTPAASLEQLATDSDRDVKQAVADHPNIPERAIEVLFSQWFAGLEGVTGSLLDFYRQARNLDPALPAVVLEQLALGGEWARLLAAQHPATPPASLTALAQEEDWRIRQAVAQNAGAPLAVLELLTTDSDHDVRSAVAQHASSNHGILERLAQDGHVSVRRSVLDRQDITPAILEHLCMDEDDELRERANRHASAPLATLARYRVLEAGEPGLSAAELEHFADLGLHARKLAVRHPNAGRTLLQRAAHDESWLVRQATAQNPNAPAEVLEVLTHDADRDVRSSLASNPSISETALAALLRDADDNVRRNALGNPSLPPSTRDAERRLLVMQQVRSSDRINRMVGLAHPLLPASELRKRRNLFAQDWRDRLAITANPNAPAAVLEQLTHDANRAVRDAAQTVLAAKGRP